VEDEEARILRARVPAELSRSLSRFPERFDLIFADPPYAIDAYEELLLAVESWLAPSGEIAVEHESRRELPGGCGELLQVDQRRYGDTCLSFYQMEPGAQDGRKKASSSK